MADDLANGGSTSRAVAQTLHARQQAELIFTRLGQQLLALTPACALPALFSRAEQVRYRALDRQLPPHIFEHGARALAATAAEGSCECLLFVGAAGSGKTYLAQRALEQLCAVSASAAPLEVCQRPRRLLLPRWREFSTREFSQHRIASHRTAPHRIASHRTAPHGIAPHRAAPHRTAPHRTAPHRTAPHRTAPHHTPAAPSRSECSAAAARPFPATAASSEEPLQRERESR
jgi:hypothetical protein